MKTLTINSQDLGDVATIDTYQTFTGDQADENLISYYNEEHNTDYDYDDFEWDYDHAQIVKDFAKRRAEFLESESPAIHKCVPVSTGSPREYNYSTDYAMFEIDYDDDLVEKFIKENQEAYDKFYRNSGWYSHTEWRDDADEQKAENIEMSKLDYYLNKTIDHDTAYYAVAEHEYEIYENNTTMKLKDNNKGE